MRCPNCGQESEGRFCAHCGARLPPSATADAPSASGGSHDAPQVLTAEVARPVIAPAPVVAPTVGPLTWRQVFTGTFQLYSDNNVLFAKIQAIALVPASVLSVAVPTFAWLADLVATLIVLAPLIAAIAAAYRGESISMLGAYRRVGVGGFFTFIAVLVLSWLIGAIGLVLLIIPGIYALVRFAFVSQAVVVERRSVFGAFGRSWQLVAGSWWRVFGIATLLYLLAVAFLGAAWYAIALNADSSKAAAAAIPLAEIVVWPFVFGVLTVVYNDLRLRKGEDEVVFQRRP